MPNGSRRALLLDAWPLLLSGVLTLPLLTRSGQVLARDLVFVPHQPWTDASIGLGGAAPRAVPLDTVVSLATAQLLDGGVVARIAIPLILATAGWGAHRLVRDLGVVARLAAGGLAVWNPYVVERLALGQWALLAGYAALPWLVVAADRYRRSATGRDLGAVASWGGLAALTPTGGLLAAASALVCGLGRTRASIRLGLVVLVLQLPWLLPSLLGPAALTSDADGVPAFAADAEGPGGVLTALLGLGGIWDSRSVPASRDGIWVIAAAAVSVLALVLGWRGLRRLWGDRLFLRVVALAAGGMALAALPTVPLGETAMSWAVEHLPGGGLARDSQKLLAPYVVLVVAALGVTVDRAVVRVRHLGTEVVVAVGLLAVPLPFVLLPDATSLVWRTVDPVHYPPGFAAVAEIVDGSGTLATLPWRSYRSFSWGNGLVSSDPAVRWFDTDVLVSDELVVGSRTIDGESPRARALGSDLRRLPLDEALRANGVRWALLYRDDPESGSVDTEELVRVHRDADIELYAVPDPQDSSSSASPAVTALVVVGYVVAGLTVAIGVVAAWRGRWRRPHRRNSLL